MRLVILTSVRRGYASRSVPVLCANPRLNVVRLILTNSTAPDFSKALVRKTRKTMRIGLLGALNGIRIRDWYKDEEVDDIEKVCSQHHVEIIESDHTNSARTAELLKECRADLGISLGNGYIASKIFSLPTYGTINVHTEILPRFQGAHSIIWPIYEGLQETGFTIHQIDDHIDTGPILFQEKYPIVLHPTLRETVKRNLETAWSHVPHAIAYVCENYLQLRDAAKIQDRGRPYTTPTIWQFLRMIRNHKKMIDNTT
ncbi:formyltransferase family protein [Desulfomonile tiedjei]|uniref:Methionyl-tRNA formyltransferase n=1 Tax=Desulfomonile tiedjei (strain ATCC 49306 / DSM 6799 / DCB-1) TaxID=706587 RepID=I4C249_DESTA|nr:formyltransferase family protein [Desulfomonile tiedjei]AFM23640.1 methionyl-tRNA formyltransferase [Desulfomonile tiedjei DSM 6799]